MFILGISTAIKFLYTFGIAFLFVCLFAWGFPNQSCQLNSVLMHFTQLLIFSRIACILYFCDPSNCTWIVMQRKLAVWCVGSQSSHVCVCLCNMRKITVQEWDWVYFCLDPLLPLVYRESNSALRRAIVWKWLYTPSCSKSPIMSKHNKTTISYMFSRSTHKSADILLERKCAATLGECVFVCVKQ